MELQSSVTLVSEQSRQLSRSPAYAGYRILTLAPIAGAPRDQP